jgi:hypothetical protein
MLQRGFCFVKERDNWSWETLVLDGPGFPSGDYVSASGEASLGLTRPFSPARADSSQRGAEMLFKDKHVHRWRMRSPKMAAVSELRR